MAVKHDDDKMPIHLVPPEAIIEMAQAMKHGAGKYGDYNWATEDGLDWTRLSDSAMRHILQWLGGENYDKESGNHHIGAALSSLAMLMASIRRNIGEDTRDPFSCPLLMYSQELTKGAHEPVVAKTYFKEDDQEKQIREVARHVRNLVGAPNEDVPDRN